MLHFKENSSKKFIQVLTFLLFFAPLVIFSHSTYPFIYYKAFWIETITQIILVVYLLSLFYYWRFFRPRFTLLGAGVIFFYIVIVVSSLLSDNLTRSLWSREERMTGLVLMLHYFALFVVWRSVFSKETWLKFWMYFTLILNAVTVIGLVQVFKPSLFLNLGSDRVASTLGNPIFLAGLATFIFFSSLFFIVQSKLRMRYWWVASALISFVALLATQTRGDLIGWWVGVVILLISVLIVFSKAKNKWWKTGVAFLAFMILAPLLLIFLRNTVVIKSVPALYRLASTPLEASTGGTRLIMWQTAFSSWRERPWLGWGWENFYDAANKHYNPSLLKYGHHEEWTDNAHNVVLNTLATTGFLGLLAYLGIYGLAFFVLIRSGVVRGSNDKILAIIFGSFLVSHFVRNLFVFEDISSYLTFFWILAGIDISFNWKSLKSVGVVSRREQSERFFSPSKKYFIYPAKFLRGILFIVLILGTLFTFYRVVYIPAKADHIAVSALKKSMTDFSSALELHREAIKIKENPYRADIAFDFSQFIFTWMSGHRDFAFSDYRELAEEMFNISDKAMKAFLSSYPNDPRGSMVLARSYLDGYEFWQNLSYLEQAETQYAEAIKYSPRRQTLLYGLIETKRMRGKYDEALTLAHEAINLESTIGESYWVAAKVYNDKKEIDQAYLFSKKAYGYGYNFNVQDLVVAFPLFVTKGEGDLLADGVDSALRSSARPNSVLLNYYVQYLEKKEDYTRVDYWRGKIR